jgi:succinate dehydrogenase/fumarate reductase flavoprotein subunit
MVEFSRRGFMRGAALASFGAASAGLLGCSNNAASGGATGAGNGDAQAIAWDEETDFVIVGAGLAGVAAAISVAVEGDGEKCLLLEKSPAALGGGNSAYSGGQVLFTDEANYKDALQYLKDLRGHFDNTPDDVLEMYARFLKDNLNFLISLGARPDQYLMEAPGSQHPPNPITFVSSCWPEYPEIASSKGVGRVQFTDKELPHVRAFMQSVLEQHADVIEQKTEARLTALIQDGASKAILGAVYDYDGKERKVKANKAVVMCLGGFENNKAMCQDYISLPVYHPLAGVYNTGDGFDICSRVGAKMWHMNSIAGCWTSAATMDGKIHANYGTLAKEAGIVVGPSGRRYCFDVDYGVSLDWRSTVEGGTVLETAVACRHGHTNYGGEWPHTHQPSRSWFIFDAAHRETALKGIVGTMLTEDPEADGWGYSAASLTELAAKAGLPEGELERTVRNWNRDCDDGFDSAFGRPAHWMAKISEGPFFAICLEPILLNTDGGPVRNKNGQILDLDGNPIPNLYSSGEFGSVWCNMYQGGGNLGECIAFGRISVRHALGKSLEI